MHDATLVERIQLEFLSVAPVLDERSRRHWAAAEAREIGWGGVTLVSRATGLSRTTIAAGMADLQDRPGGGRRHVVDVDSGLWAARNRLCVGRARVRDAWLRS